MEEISPCDFLESPELCISQTPRSISVNPWLPNKVIVEKIALQHSAPALFLALWESVSLCPEGVPSSLLWQGLLKSHLNKVLGCFAIGLAVPDSRGTQSASLCHTQLL